MRIFIGLLPSNIRFHFELAELRAKRIIRDSSKENKDARYGRLKGGATAAAAAAAKRDRKNAISNSRRRRFFDLQGGKTLYNYEAIWLLVT